jgi:23S rRNA (uracil1939-C5)-methyltransferase
MDKMKSHYSDSISANLKEFHKVCVEKIVPGGDGLVRMDGKVVFIPSVLENEIINFKMVSEGKKFTRGQVLQILQPSKDRVIPFCSFYDRCGGCNLQHLSYDSQLSLKESFVREHFKRLAAVDLSNDFHFVPSKPKGFRNRVQFHKAERGCGFKTRSSDRVIPVNHCPVLTESLNVFLSREEGINQDRETFFGVGDQFYRDSILENIKVHIKGIPVHFRTDLFFQSNLSLLPELLDFSLGGYSGNHGMDLYSGVGLFSVFMRDHFSSITAIELNPKTESFYKQNMAGYQYDYYGMSLEDWLNKKSGKSADLIVVDPPRTGLSPSVRSFILKMNVPQLVYVSCDPVTQARDTKDLLAGGYKIEAARGFDFYPQTNHMETVLRFRKE